MGVMGSAVLVVTAVGCVHGRAPVLAGCQQTLFRQVQPPLPEAIECWKASTDLRTHSLTLAPAPAAQTPALVYNVVFNISLLLLFFEERKGSPSHRFPLLHT